MAPPLPRCACRCTYVASKPPPPPPLSLRSLHSLANIEKKNIAENAPLRNIVPALDGHSPVETTLHSRHKKSITAPVVVRTRGVNRCAMLVCFKRDGNSLSSCDFPPSGVTGCYLFHGQKKYSPDVTPPVCMPSTSTSSICLMHTPPTCAFSTNRRLQARLANTRSESIQPLGGANLQGR